jgi:hypothetical protein
MKVQSTSVWNSSLRINMCDQQCHGIPHEPLRIKAALRSHQIDNVKTAYSPNNSNHELSCADLLSGPFYHLFSVDAPLRGVFILKREPILVIHDNDVGFSPRYALEQGQQLLAFLDSCGSEPVGQLVGNLLQMRIFQVNRVTQVVQNCRVRHIDDLEK